MEKAILVVFHMKGCRLCKPVIGPGGACAALQHVNVLEVEAAHPLVGDVEISSFPQLFLATPKATWGYGQGARTQKAIQNWIRSKLQLRDEASEKLAPVYSEGGQDAERSYRMPRCGQSTPGSQLPDADAAPACRASYQQLLADAARERPPCRTQRSGGADLNQLLAGTAQLPPGANKDALYSLIREALLRDAA